MASEVIVEVQASSSIHGNNQGLDDSSWWARYAHLGLSKLSPTAQAVVEADSRFLVTNCLPEPSESALWPSSRVRTGVVVGGIQSGKTASMLGVSALILDEGVDILIVLAGTRIALWRQTFERFLEQLDGSTAETSGKNWARRVLVPEPFALLQDGQRIGPTEYMAAAGSRIERALANGIPSILLIPKVESHLLEASRELAKRIARAQRCRTEDFHMVVLDDEADDASVLDAEDSKTIPRRIEMLWSGQSSLTTISDRLFATYVAYTATPQANFLQQAHNPLAPRNFSAALRAPYKRGAAVAKPRTATFEEPMGISRYYCGGEMFYREIPLGRPGSLCQTLPFPDPDTAPTKPDHAMQVRAASDRLLMDGFLAYLMSGAVRLMRQLDEGALAPSVLASGAPESERLRFPKPHSMLVHPSARMNMQLDEAQRLVLLAAGLDPDLPSSRERLPEGVPGLDVAELQAQLIDNPIPWLEQLDKFLASKQALELLPGATGLFAPEDRDRGRLLQLLHDEVIPLVKIRIVNSDPSADDRPQFDPTIREPGVLEPPADLFTVFVSGNVMSRGITIDGLCVSVFTRPASEPAADTQMQMQRWFGYRGSYVHLCRLFTFSDQLDLFRLYHENDVAIRREILGTMEEPSSPTPRIMLQGPTSLATAKIPTTRLPLHPGPTPSVRLLEADDPSAANHNADHLAAVLAEGNWVPIGPPTKPRGFLRQGTATLLEASELLDGLQFSAYDPTPESSLRYRRWASLENQLDLTASERPLFRPPGLRNTDLLLNVRSCPYSIAAYMRLWNAALKRIRCDGLYPSDAPGTPWALAHASLPTPAFYVGVAYGESGPSRWPQLNAFGVQTMIRSERDGAPRMAATLWGRRGTSGKYHGDPLFDYNLHGLAPPCQGDGLPLWRERGHPGLLLFHVVRPANSPYDAVTMGIALPHGGPDQFAALPVVSLRS